MPDEVVRPIPAEAIESSRGADTLDQLAIFADVLPAWVGRDGLPLSWKHWRYGLPYITRRGIRETLETAQAVRAGRATEEWYKEWRKSHRMMVD